MIHIEVLESRDLLSIGHFKLYFPRIFIGRSIHNNIPIEDDSLEMEVGVLKHFGDSLSFVTKNSYKLNNKEVRGILNISKNDTIEVQGLKFKVIDFDSPSSKHVDNYYQYLEEIKVSEPEKYDYLQALETHYIKLTGHYENELLEN